MMLPFVNEIGNKTETWIKGKNKRGDTVENVATQIDRHKKLFNMKNKTLVTDGCTEIFLYYHATNSKVWRFETGGRQKTFGKGKISNDVMEVKLMMGGNTKLCIAIRKQILLRDRQPKNLWIMFCMICHLQWKNISWNITLTKKKQERKKDRLQWIINGWMESKDVWLWCKVQKTVYRMQEYKSAVYLPC